MDEKTRFEIEAKAASDYDTLLHWLDFKIEGVAALLYAASCDDLPQYEGFDKDATSAQAVALICSDALRDCVTRIREEIEEHESALKAIQDEQAA